MCGMRGRDSASPLGASPQAPAIYRIAAIKLAWEDGRPDARSGPASRQASWSALRLLRSRAVSSARTAGL